MDSSKFNVKITHSAPSYWDDLLFKAEKETNICQSIYWANVLQRLEGAKPYFITVSDHSGTILSLCLIIKRPLKIHRSPKSYLWNLECIDGPVILEEGYAREVTDILLKEVLQLKRFFSTLNITIIPSRTSKYAFDKEIALIYKNLGFSVETWASYLLDLNKTEDELFSNTKHSARKCIKKCHRMGIKVEKIKNIEELKNIFWKYRSKFEKEFKRPVRVFSPVAWEEDKNKRYHYFITKSSDNRILAVLGMYIFNGIATEIASSISLYAYQKKIPAQDLLHWEMILAAKRLGCRIFDLAGINPNPKDSKEEGIRRFKEKWGGRYTEYYVYKKDLLISKIFNLRRIFAM